MMIARMDNKKRAENLSATDRVKINYLVKRYWFIIENKKSDSETQPMIRAQQITDQLPDDGGAIAGVPLAVARSPRPKRNISRPKRFMD